MNRSYALPHLRGLLLCLLLCAPLAVSAQDPIVLVVSQEEDDGFFTTISEALDAIPNDMGGNYVIEIRDDETYEEEVKVDVNSSASATLTIRPAPGNTPGIVSPKKKKPAIKVSSPFVIIEGLKLIGGEESPGIHLDWADDVTIRNCDVFSAEKKSAAGIKIQGAQRALVENNRVHDNDVGILIFDAKDGGTILRNNRIYENEERGIWIYKKTANTTVLNNTLYYNTVGIRLGKDGGNRNDLGTGNVFRNNIVVIKNNDGYCVLVVVKDGDSLPADTVFDYNILFAEDPGAPIARFGDTDFGSLGDWQSAMGLDAHSLSVDPLLVSPISDLHPKSTAGSYHNNAWTADDAHSPAIDAGDPASAFSAETDPNGGRINIGAWGNTAQASRAAAVVTPVPTGSFASAQQGNDGSGNVAVSIIANHSAGADVQAKIEWSDAENGTYQAATLAGPVTAEVDDSGGPPGVDNGTAYQLGAGGDTRIVTDSGSNTVSFTWNSATDVASADGNFWLRLTVTDGTTEQATPALQQVKLDNVAPSGLADLAVTELSGSTLSFSWTAATETNFAGYALWFGTNQSDVTGRTGSASSWNQENDGDLTTVSTAVTTITGLQRGTEYFVGIWVADDFGHEAGPSETSSFTAGRDTVFHYVAKSGANPGTVNDRNGPWSSIQDAINAIPERVDQQESYYVVEILDSGQYEEKVSVEKKTSELYSVTVRPAAGQGPTIAGPNNKVAVLIKTDYAVFTGIDVTVSKKAGVFVNGAGSVVVSDLSITGDGNDAGVKIQNSKLTSVRNVRIHDADTGIHFAKNAKNSGIQNVQILGSGSRARGVYFDEKTEADTLVNISIVGYTQGLSFRGGNKAAGNGHVMRNSILEQVGTCVVLDKALGNTFGLLDYNDLHPVTGGHVGNIEGANFTSLADWRNESGLDQHSMSLDPLFTATDVAPASMDLHVASQAGRWDGSDFVSDPQTSPTIDAGHPRDAFGNETSPNGNRVNLGAWGNTAEASRSGGVSLVQGGLPWSKYLMAGVPVTPRDGSPDAVLADDFPGENGENIWGQWVRLARWDTGQDDYVYYEEDRGASGQPPNLAPGLGYWLIQWWSIIDEDGNSIGDSASVDGALVPSTEDYAIALTTSGAGGFNQVANPFVFDIDWANTRIRDVASGREVSIAQAAESEIIDGHAYLWDWEEQAYLPIDANAGGRIGSWGGFWVEQLDTGRQLELLIAPVEASGGSGKTLQVRPSPTNWFIDFVVDGTADVATENGTVTVPLRDPNNRAGVHEDATRRWDPLDALDLTGLRQPYLYVYFPHDDVADPQTYWPNRPARYTYDLRDPEWLEQTWEFVVDSQVPDTDLTWTWTNPGGLPEGYLVALEDVDADTVIAADITRAPVHLFSAGPSGQRRFRLNASFEDILGDIGGDRIVAAEDARQVLRHVLGVEVLDDSDATQARVRDPESGADLTPLDAAWILRYSTGLVKTLPVPAAELETQPSAKSLHMSNAAPQADGSWMLPIYIDEAAGLLSGHLQLSYDPQLLAIEEITPAAELTGFEGQYALSDGGQINYVFAGASAPAGRHKLAQIRVQSLLGGDDLSGALQLETAQLNDGQIETSIQSPRPDEVQLYPAAPNPFNSSVTIRFGLPEAGDAELVIYNALGQKVRVLAQGEWAAGLHRSVWDGRNSAGHAVASGVYMAQLVIGDRKMVQMLALIR